MSALDFVKFLSAHLGKKKKLVIGSGAINGISMIALMYSLSIGLKGLTQTGEISIRGLMLFLCSWVVFYISQLIAVKTSSNAAYSALEEMELRLIDKLRRVDYSAFKTVSSADIYAVIGGDKNAVITAARFVASAVSAVVTIVFSLIYLSTVSVAAVVLILLEYGLITFIFHLYNVSMAKRFEADTQASGSFSQSLRNIIDGFAEVKMNNIKSEAIYNNSIKPASFRKTESYKTTEISWVKLLVANNAAIFIPLGLIVFILPVLSAANVQSVVEIMTIILIIMGPAGMLTTFISNAAMANNTLLRMESVEKQLDEAVNKEEEGDLSMPPQTPEFSVLAMNELRFAYSEEGGKTGFSLYIENFRLEKGELLIIKGGNGSGKSTFLRVLAGLFLPKNGDIMLGDIRVSSLKGSDYRSLFSIVFSDFHLFDDFYGLNIDKQILHYWAGKLEITDVIRNYEQSHELPSALSSGQRKRMALLAAILEDRKIMLLDEVAADFDPEFRTKYYREIIPELKTAGRTLILVSHDDRYFDVADRVVEFREGIIVS